MHITKDSMVKDTPLPSVGVLLATYNGALYCKEQILSLLWQRDVDVHVYVRDDGSRDETMEIISNLALQNPGRITVVDNRGLLTGSACGNFFALLAEIDVSHHTYFAFADQDDVWMPDKLCRAIALMNANGAEAYSSDLIAYHEGQKTAWVVDKRGISADLDYLFQGASAGCTYVITQRATKLTADIMAKAPAMCPGASHDWIVYAICRTHGLKWVRDGAARILYRQHTMNLYGTQRGLRELITKLKLTRSGWYRTQILWLRNVIRGTEDECRAITAIEKRDLISRWWLVRQARRFRRTPKMVAQFRIATFLGLI